jgi:hypothetical protein
MMSLMSAPHSGDWTTELLSQPQLVVWIIEEVHQHPITNAVSLASFPGRRAKFRSDREAGRQCRGNIVAREPRFAPPEMELRLDAGPADPQCAAHERP